ncbi:MAG: hypothetical protein SGJ10_10555 [Bacteroidota bacterium]|nr:hypothetical protein [Bacteroidota bacterium]
MKKLSKVIISGACIVLLQMQGNVANQKMNDTQIYEVSNIDYSNTHAVNPMAEANVKSSNQTAVYRTGELFALSFRAPNARPKKKRPTYLYC